jgi:LEA14-like dessication related protein
MNVGRTLSRFVALCCLLAQLGCAGTSASLAAPRVEVVGLAALGVTPDRQRFRVSLLLDNPNPEPLVIRELRFTLRLAGEGILDGRSAAPITVPALSREPFTLDVDSDLVSSLSRLQGLTQGPNNALPYEIFGNVTTDRRFQPPLPFALSGEVPLSTTAGR